MSQFIAPVHSAPAGVRFADLTVMDHGIDWEGGLPIETLDGYWTCPHCGWGPTPIVVAHSDFRYNVYCPACAGEIRYRAVEPKPVLEAVR